MEQKKELAIEKRLGRVLNIYRLINDIELEELAKKLSMHEDFLLDIEQGKIINPGVSIFYDIAEALDLVLEIRPKKYTKDDK